MEIHMLDDAIKTQLKAYLEKVIYPIEIVANVNGSDKSNEVLALVQDIAGLSDKVSWRETATAPCARRLSPSIASAAT
jgi:NADH-dependent peroxiredoxin subunit F